MAEVPGTPEDGHYGGDEVGARRGLPGGGMHVYLTGEFLHPPMVPDAGMWADGRRWVQGAARHTRDIADLADLRAGEHVLDIGCGLCGPARLLVREYGVRVTAVTNSAAHAETARRLNARAADWHDRITVLLLDGQRELPDGPFDAALSINMLYQVDRRTALFTRVFDRLVPGGRLVVDDWMLTPWATGEDVRRLTEHFSFSSFARTDEIENELMTAGFPPAEEMADLGHVARGPMALQFENQMRTYFAPQIVADWPGEHGTAVSGPLMVDQFVAGVNLTLDLYRLRRMTYRRLLVRRPAES